jgi:hypothetical protein
VGGIYEPLSDQSNINCVVPGSALRNKLMVQDTDTMAGCPRHSTMPGLALWAKLIFLEHAGVAL